MGCQVDTKYDILSYNVSARLVIEMCSLWYEEERDSDVLGKQIKIDSSSARSANTLVPHTYREYVVWRCDKGLGRWYDSKRFFNEDDFLTAREFLIQTAHHRVDIWVR